MTVVWAGGTWESPYSVHHPPSLMEIVTPTTPNAVNAESLILLDGPLGTELNARGVGTPLPLWSAAAIDTHPQLITTIHRDYAAAGATVHTANTFRTQQRTLGASWKRLTHRAVQLARQAVPSSHRIAGSLAPLEDCYRPDQSPPNSEPEHRAMADELASAGCDLILCETFPNPNEALVAVSCAVRTGLPTWLSLTAGPNGDLLTPQALAETGRKAADLGAQAVLVNCTPAGMMLRWVEALAAAKLKVPFGGYANAGDVTDRLGWADEDTAAAEHYARYAGTWIAAGATVVGGCCGTSPRHIAAVRSLHQQR